MRPAPRPTGQRRRRCTPAPERGARSGSCVELRVGAEQIRRQHDAVRLHLIEESGPDSSCFELALDLSIGADPRLAEAEDLLHRHDLAFHSGQLRYADELAAAIGQAGDLDDNVDRRSDLRAGRFRGDVDPTHPDHLLDTRERIARSIGVDRGHRAIVTGVHRLEHVERFTGANLAEDDPVGPYAQRVLDEVALSDFALPLDVRGASLEPDDVLLLELELGRIFDRYD